MAQESLGLGLYSTAKGVLTFGTDTCRPNHTFMFSIDPLQSFELMTLGIIDMI